MLECSVRPATAGDYAAFARLFPEMVVPEPTPSEATWASDLMRTTFLAERGGVVVGYTFFQVLRGTGYVRNVVTAPEARRAGVGRALLGALAAHFRAAGATRWCLNVKPDNAPAIALYERVGMRKVHESVALHVPWSRVGELPSPVARAAESPPEEDDALERAFDLPAGLFADLRTRPNKRILAVPARAGVCMFDPVFNGAFPFRVVGSSAAHARALLEAMKALARDEEHVQIVIEADPALARTFEAHGGIVKLSMHHYAGELGA